MPTQEIQLYSDPKEIDAYLKRATQTIKAALPMHMRPERMIRLAVTAFSTSAKVRQSTPQSILSSVILAAQLGLEPGVSGQGYFVPYYNSRLGVYICTFIPGWQGLAGLLNNTGRGTVWTDAVFEGDEFEYEKGTRPFLRHVPNGRHSGDPEKLTWVYACGRVNGSEQTIVEAWPAHRVFAHRDRYNKVGAEHYSFKHPEMYGRKVVLLQVLKYMPRSIELSNAIAVSEVAEIGRTPMIQEGVVIDVGETAGEIQQGNVGNNVASAGAQERTVTEIAESEEKTQKEDEKPKESGPKPAELLKQLLAKCSEINVGKVGILKKLKSMKYVEEGDTLEKLTAKQLAEILDGWEEIKDKIQNPDAAA